MYKLRIMGLCFISLLLALMTVPNAYAVTPHPMESAFIPRIVGYDTVTKDGSLPDANKLDVIIFAFANIKNGRVVLEGDAAERLQKLIAMKATNPALKVMVSVGGSIGGFTRAASTRSGRMLFARSAAHMLQVNHADGLDVDWEYPGSKAPGGTMPSPSLRERKDFTLLMKTLRETFKHVGESSGHTGKNRYLLTIASSIGPFVSGIDLASVAPYLDWFNVMTYDFVTSSSSSTGNHTGLYASARSPKNAFNTEGAVHQYLAAGVPPDKIVIGVAFYGRRFNGVQPLHDGLYQPFKSGGELVPWKIIKQNFINKNGYIRHWDPQADAPYLWDAKTHSFITYDDPDSIAAKAAFVKLHHLGGIMFWQAGLDYHNQLLDAVWSGLH